LILAELFFILILPNNLTGKNMYPIKKTIIKSISPHRFPSSPHVHVNSVRQWINESYEKNSLPEENIKKEEIDPQLVDKEEENDIKRMDIEDEIFDFA
jgi:hypothetical protein